MDTVWQTRMTWDMSAAEAAVAENNREANTNPRKPRFPAMPLGPRTRLFLPDTAMKECIQTVSPRPMGIQVTH